MRHKTQKNDLNSKLYQFVRTANYNCAYVKIMAVLIIFSCYSPDSHQSHNAVYWRTGVSATDTGSECIHNKQTPRAPTVKYLQKNRKRFTLKMFSNYWLK